MKPTIKIGASGYVGDYVIPRALVDWEKTYPDVELQITVSDSGEVFARVIDGTLEAGVIGAALEDKRVVTEEFIRNADELILIAPLDHPFAKRGEISAQELKGQPFIVREPGSATRMWYREKLATEGIDFDDLDVISEVDSHQAAISSVEAGAGLTFVLRGAARDAMDAGRVKEVKIKELSPMMGSLYLVHRQESTMSEPAKRLFKFLEQERARLTA